MGNFLFGKGNSGTCFGKDFPVFFPGIQRLVNPLFQSAGSIAFGTTVADIRRSLEFQATGFFEIRESGVTAVAIAAEFTPLVFTGIT